MGINQQYQPLYDQAKHMQYHMHDMLGSHDPQARILHREMEGLMTDMETGKNPYDLAHRIETIQHQMHQVEHQSKPLMSYGHAQEFHQNFEHMRNHVRKFDNYSG